MAYALLGAQRRRRSTLSVSLLAGREVRPMIEASGSARSDPPPLDAHPRYGDLPGAGERAEQLDLAEERSDRDTTPRVVDPLAPAQDVSTTMVDSDERAGRVTAIANQKGGVGKTTTAVNLGACLAERGLRTLVIDLDPQGNASTGLGIDPRSLQTSIYDVIIDQVPLEDCIEPTAVRNLFAAPASLDLAGAEIELVPALGRENRLRTALASVRGEYDRILIDCPPSLGLLTVNALCAADELLVPIQCEYYALEGLGQLLRNVELVRRNLNPKLELGGIVLVMYDRRTRLAEQVVTEVREHFGEKVCQAVVPRTVRLSEAPSYGQPITVFDSGSRGADAYRALAAELAPSRVDDGEG